MSRKTEADVAELMEAASGDTRLLRAMLHKAAAEKWNFEQTKDELWKVIDGRQHLERAPHDKPPAP